MKLRHALLSCAVVAASACTSSIKSEYGPTGVGEGVSYYLPMRLVRLEVERKAVKPDTTKEFKALHLAQIALTAAEEAQAKAKAAADAAARAHDDAKKAQPPLKPERLAELATADLAAKAPLAEAVNTTAQRQKDVAEAEKAYLAAVARKKKADGAGASVEYEETATIGLSPYYPDEKKRFIADLNHNWFRSDDWDLAVTPAGLLTKADSNPSGEADEVVITLGKVALAILNPGGMLGGGIASFTKSVEATPGSKGLAADACPVDKTFRFEIEFDPVLRATSAATINKSLAELCSTFRIDYASLADIAAIDVKAFRRGLAYRRERPFTVSIKRFPFGPDDMTRSTHVDRFEPYKTATLMIPNGAPIEVLPYGASFVSDQKLSGTFENGMLTRTDFEKPGEAQTVAGIPAAVISGAAAMVSDVLTARFNNLTKQKETIGVEATTFENMKKLLEAQAAYEKAQADYLKEKTAAPE